MQNISSLFTAFFSFKYWQLILIGLGFLLLLIGSVLIWPIVAQSIFQRKAPFPDSTAVENWSDAAGGESHVASSSGRPDQKIVVEISGAVVSPGLYQVEKNARLKDALDQAGGVLPTADHDFLAREINLAGKLVDAQKIYIPFVREHFSSSNLVSINTGKREDLLTLPGLTKTRVEQLIKLRPFSSLDDFQKRMHLTITTWTKLKPFLSL